MGGKRKAIFASMGKKLKFLNHYVETGVRTKAAEMAGIALQTHYTWIRNDQLYAKDFEIARQVLNDAAEDEVYRRAFVGDSKPVGFHKGRPSAYIQEYSDNLAMFHLRSTRPETYRDGYDVNVNHQGEITVKDAQTQLLAMMERNPMLANDLRKIIGGVNSDDARMLEVIEGGGGPQLGVTRVGMSPNPIPAKKVKNASLSRSVSQDHRDDMRRRMRSKRAKDKVLREKASAGDVRSARELLLG